MSAPKRIQRRRTKGWRMPEGAVYVGRPTKWGNPFAPTVIPGWATASREYAVQDFIQWLSVPHLHWRNTSGGFPDAIASEEAAERIHQDIGQLRGKDLACWCPVDVAAPCHADVLLEIANGGRP